MLPESLRSVAKKGRGLVRRRTRPAVWHDLRRVRPLDARFGLGRGTPVDRYYIERFLEGHGDSVRGHVLEVGDASYTRKFGGEAVRRSSVLHATDDNPEASIVGDLSTGLPGYERAFDCLILTQVLPFIFDLRGAVETTRELCAPGGTVLVTVPGISQISRYDMDRWGDFWRFTDLSVARMFADVFGASSVRVTSFGNVLTAAALLYGIAAEELTADELDTVDPDYPVILGVVARLDGA
jgi:hypothetical protein